MYLPGVAPCTATSTRLTKRPEVVMQRPIRMVKYHRTKGIQTLPRLLIPRIFGVTLNVTSLTQLPQILGTYFPKPMGYPFKNQLTGRAQSCG